ncbi:MAG: LysM peptidoglycan-binding domain-containing protein [Bacillota bacterium]|nr:LysM peptidoglycan-binding domain-containing protein [Bacillota bacterium]
MQEPRNLWRRGPLVVLLVALLTAFLALPGSAATYVVQPGDSLFKIAQRTGTTAAELQRVNGLTSSEIYPGQVLTLAGNQSPSGGSGFVHTVQPGESLFLIARKYGITVQALQQANGLAGSYIEAGQRLWIPAGGTAPGGKSGGQIYVVRPGDTLFLIARRYGIAVIDLKRANNLWTDYLEVGQRLVIPGGSTVGGSSRGTSSSFSRADLDLLARLVQAEAGGEPYEGMVAVAATVLNRLRDPRYPDTIPGVIYQVVDGKYYQYSPVLDGRINQPATPIAYKAVQDALAGWDPSRGANGFYNPAKTSNAWVASQPVTARIGNHVFFRY